MTDEETKALRSALVAEGYDHNVAEALAERGVTVAMAALLSKREVLEHYLEWNGIIGYTDSILRVLENAEECCNM